MNQFITRNIKTNRWAVNTINSSWMNYSSIVNWNTKYCVLSGIKQLLHIFWISKPTNSILSNYPNSRIKRRWLWSWLQLCDINEKLPILVYLHEKRLAGWCTNTFEKIVNVSALWCTTILQTSPETVFGWPDSFLWVHTYINRDQKKYLFGGAVCFVHLIF